MNDTAWLNAGRFFDAYVCPMNNPTVVDIGGTNLNGSIKDVYPFNAKLYRS